MFVPRERESIGFVVPIDSVEVEETGKLVLAIVSELGEFSR